MNLIEYLYLLVCSDLNFILFLVATIAILNFINFLMFFYTVSNKYLANDFWDVKSKY